MGADVRPELPVLIRARQKITDPANWGKGIRGANPLDADRSLETCCAAEAIEDVTIIAPDMRQRAYRRLRNAIGIKIGSDNDIVEWNDAPERTHEEVLAAFDKAIEAAS
jgi:hypothetical protein